MDAELTQILTGIARAAGAIATGVATTETLAGGPPSTNLEYVLPGAKSALSYAVPLDPPAIDLYLAKKDRKPHERDNIRTSVLSSGISLELASFIIQKGHQAAPQAANNVYRDDDETKRHEDIPPISHRYLAARSGVGHFGISGNVITKSHGAAVILGCVVTTAQLVPTDPLPPEENYCDDCKLCQQACVAGFMSEPGKETVTLGGVEFSYGKRSDYSRCGYACGGFTGLHPSGKWSTWSSARFPIPDQEQDCRDAMVKAIGPYLQRPREEGGNYHILVPGHRIELTCGNCQLVCHPDKEVRASRFKSLTSSGVVIQHPDGSYEAVTPEQAKAHLDAMPPETRALYEEAPVNAPV